MRLAGWLVLAALLAGCAAPAPLSPAAGPQSAPLSCDAPCLHDVGHASRPWEPMIAVDPRDAAHVVIATSVFEAIAGLPVATSWIETHATKDGGKTWATTRAPSPDPTLDAMGDAFVTFLPDGTPLLAGLAFHHAGSGTTQAYASARTAYSLFVARSSDGGASWDAPVIVRAGRGALALALAPPVLAQAAALAWDANDKEWIVAAPDGTLLATWADIHTVDPPEEPLSRQDLVAATSRDGGRSWSAPTLVEKGGQWLGAAPAILPDGRMAVAYVDILSLDLHVATSADGGRSWTPRSVGSAAFFPALVAVGPTLLLATAASNESAPDTIQMDEKPQRVEVRASEDGGASWSAPRVVDDPEAPGRATPRLASAGSTALLSWFHAVDGGAQLRVVALRGDDVSAPLVLDEPHAPSSALGDYMGLAATPTGAWASWVTSPDGRAFRLEAAHFASGP